MKTIIVESSIGKAGTPDYFNVEGLAVNIPGTLPEAFELSSEDAVLKAFQAYWKQNATQGPKEALRVVRDDAGLDSEAFLVAVEDYREAVAQYEYTGKRRVGDGVKQAESQAGTRRLKAAAEGLDDTATFTLAELKEMFGDVPI